MKVYFTASLRYRSEFIHVYRNIVNWLLARKYTVFEKVLSYHFHDSAQASTHDVIRWYKEWSSYIAECDVALVEGSYPSSVHIGFEIGTILSRGKPVVLLYRSGKNPVFIDEFFSSKLVKSEYEEDTLPSVLTWCFKEVEHISNRRFTFFVSPEIDKFLSGVSEKNRRTRSEYIRMLIEREMCKRR